MTIRKCTCLFRERFSPENYRRQRKFKQKGFKKKKKDQNRENHRRKKTRTYRKCDSPWWHISHKLVKHYSHRKHRVFERKTLSSGRYDQFHAKTMLEVESLWSWD